MQNEYLPMGMQLPPDMPADMLPRQRGGYRGGFVAGLMSFAAPVLILIITFALGGIAPFGVNTMLCAQNAEWFAALEQWRRVLGGEAGLMYSFARGLGGDWFSVWTNGLSSPFLLPIVFFPAGELPQAMVLIALLRAGAAGFFAYLAMRNLAGRMPFAAMSFAVAYASGSLFCLGFLAPQYADAAVWLPLAAAGVAGLVKTGRALLLFFGAAAFLICCGRLWPLLIVFCIGYFAWCQLVLGARRDLWARLGLFVAALAAGAGAAMVAMIPAFTVNTELSSAISSMEETDFSGFFNIMMAMFSGAFSADVTVPLLFCSAMTVLLLFLYFFSSRLPLGERQVCALFVVFLIISMAVPALCWMWLGFSEPTGLINSCGCVFSLFAVCAAVRLTAQPERAKVGKVLLSWLVVAAVFAAGVLFGSVKTDASGLIFTAAFLTMYAAITIVALSGRGIGVGFCLVVLICVGCECAVGGMLGLKSAGEQLPLVSVTEQHEADSRLYDLRSVIRGSEREGASTFYRIRGAQEASLPCADSPIQYTHECALLQEVLGIQGTQGYTPVTDSVFSVKYIAGADALSGYPSAGVVGEMNIGRCQTPLSLCLAVSEQAGRLNSFSTNPFTAQNEMVSAMAGLERSLFINAPLNARDGIEAGVTETMNGVEFVRTGEGGSAQFTVTVPADGPLYMYLDSKSHRAERVTVNGTELGERPLGAVCCLGRFARGAQVSVNVSISGDRLALDGTWFAVLDTSLYEAVMQSLEQRAASGITIEGSSVRCSVTLSAGQMIMTSIPWQRGWSVYINGTKADTVRVCGALLGAYAAPGVHSIVFSYEPPEFMLSIIISAAFIVLGTLLFIILDVTKLSVMYRRSRSLPEPEPEPEEDIFMMYQDYMIPDAESLDEHEEDFDDYFRGM